MAKLACVTCALVLAGCSGSPSAPAVPASAAAPTAAPTASAAPTATAAAVAPAPPPRAGTDRRHFELNAGGSLRVPVSIDVPSEWGIRVLGNGTPLVYLCGDDPEIGRGLSLDATSCRTGQDEKACFESLAEPGFLLRKYALRREELGPTRRWVIAEGTDRFGGAFDTPFVRAELAVFDDKLPGVVKCSVDAIGKREVERFAAYKATCESLVARPPTAALPSGPVKPKPAASRPAPSDDEKAMAAVARAFVLALVQRDAKAASALLLGEKDCAAAGKPAGLAECKRYAAALRKHVTAQIDKAVPKDFEIGEIEPEDGMTGLTVLAVRSKADPCGPGVPVPLQKGKDRFAVVLAIPVEGEGRKRR